MCLAQGHKTVTPVRLEPADPRSRVKHSTTEPLCSLYKTICLGLAYAHGKFKVPSANGLGDAQLQEIHCLTFAHGLEVMVTQNVVYAHAKFEVTTSNS